MSRLDFKFAKNLNESLTNDYVKLSMHRKKQ